MKNTGNIDLRHLTWDAFWNDGKLLDELDGFTLLSDEDTRSLRKFYRFEDFLAKKFNIETKKEYKHVTVINCDLMIVTYSFKNTVIAKTLENIAQHYLLDNIDNILLTI